MIRTIKNKRKLIYLLGYIFLGIRCLGFIIIGVRDIFYNGFSSNIFIIIMVFSFIILGLSLYFCATLSMLGINKIRLKIKIDEKKIDIVGICILLATVFDLCTMIKN